MESALIRRSSLGQQMHQSDVSDFSAEGRKTRSLNLLLDPAPLAKEYLERWTAIQRIRRCVLEQALEIEGVSTLAGVLRDLWTVWWMVTEDGEFVGWLTHVWRKLSTHGVANLHRWVEQASSGRVCPHLRLLTIAIPPGFC
jgi:hypothetical protein